MKKVDIPVLYIYQPGACAYHRSISQT